MRRHIYVILLSVIIHCLGYAQTTRVSYPQLSQRVEIGMSQEQVENINGKIQFVPCGAGRALGFFRSGNQTLTLFIEERHVVRFSYSWIALDEADQKAKTHALLAELVEAYGNAHKEPALRVGKEGVITIATKWFSVDPVTIAVFESWNGSVTVTVWRRNDFEEELKSKTLEKKLKDTMQKTTSQSTKGVERFSNKRVQSETSETPSSGTLQDCLKDL